MRRLAALLLIASAACNQATVDSTSTGSTTSTTASGSTTEPSSGWVALAPMTAARSEHPAAVVGDDVVVAGGLIEVGVGRTGVTPTVEGYTPDTDTWHALLDLPEARHHGMSAAVGQRLFFMGGYTPAGDPSASVWELVEGEWVGRRAIPAPVAAGAAVTMDESIFVIGGVPEGNVYRYDIADDTWAALPAPDTPREHVAAVALDGEIWAIAGRWEGEISDSTEIYNPDAQVWRAGPSLLEARSGFGAVVIDGAIFVAGGEVSRPTRLWTRWRTRPNPRLGGRPSSHSPAAFMATPWLPSAPRSTSPAGRLAPPGWTTMVSTYRLQLG